jgi:cyclophilin family peptidyl-prolyl cis-trans isomerase
VFGKVTEGLDVLRGIRQNDVISTIIIKESG